MKKPAEPLAATYPVIELVGGNRLILGLGDGRMFGVDLDGPFEGDTATIAMEYLDDAGVPQGATLIHP